VILQVPVSVHLDLYRYWDSKRAGRAIPARHDIDPAEMRHLLPHLSLVEATIEGRFRYRLVGTRVVQDLGRDVTGTEVGARDPVARDAAFHRRAGFFGLAGEGCRHDRAGGLGRFRRGTRGAHRRLGAPLRRLGAIVRLNAWSRRCHRVGTELRAT
jgi:hypothetical protein